LSERLILFNLIVDAGFFIAEWILLKNPEVKPVEEGDKKKKSCKVILSLLSPFSGKLMERRFSFNSTASANALDISSFNKVPGGDTTSAKWVLYWSARGKRVRK